MMYDLLNRGKLELPIKTNIQEKPKVEKKPEPVINVDDIINY